jgi:hypothetical protein
MKKFLSMAVLCAGVMGSANAVVLMSENFDAMTVGNPLAGNAGFDAFSDSQYFVSNARSVSGSNSARIDTGAQSTYWAWKNLGPGVGTTGPNKIVIASADIYIESTGTVDTLTGLDAYNSAVNRIAAVRVQKSTGVVSLVVGTATATNLVALTDRWNKLELVMDFNAGTARAVLNGVASANSITISTANGVADVDLYSVRNNGATSASHYDNYMVQAVPEPATMTVLALGLAAIARRRKVA